MGLTCLGAFGEVVPDELPQAGLIRRQHRSVVSRVHFPDLAMGLVRRAFLDHVERGGFTDLGELLQLVESSVRKVDISAFKGEREVPSRSESSYLEACPSFVSL